MKKCPYPIINRSGFRGIFGGSDPKQKAESGYYESDWEWMDANREACIWFLRQHVKDPVE